MFSRYGSRWRFRSCNCPRRPDNGDEMKMMMVLLKLPYNLVQRRPVANRRKTAGTQLKRSMFISLERRSCTQLAIEITCTQSAVRTMKYINNNTVKQCNNYRISTNLQLLTNQYIYSEYRIDLTRALLMKEMRII